MRRAGHLARLNSELEELQGSIAAAAKDISVTGQALAEASERGDDEEEAVLRRERAALHDIQNLLLETRKVVVEERALLTETRRESALLVERALPGPWPAGAPSHVR